jgi:hypothetical protein
LNEVAHENESLIVKLFDSHVLIDSFKSENCVLVEKAKSLENELGMSKSQLEKFSSDKLARLLNSQKSYGDKCGLCCNYSASISKTIHDAKGKIKFVPSSSCEKTTLSGVDKGKGVILMSLNLRVHILLGDKFFKGL